MRLSLRFVVPLLLALSAIAYAVVPLTDRLMVRWFMRDLDIRSTLVANAMQEPLNDLVQNGNRTRILQFFGRITRDERLYALAFCPVSGNVVATPTLPAEVRCDEIERYRAASGRLVSSERGALLVSVRPVDSDSVHLGQLVVVHDLSFVERRSAETRRYLFAFFIILMVTVSLITVLIAQISWRGWMHGLRTLLRGDGLTRPPGKPEPEELRPIAHDLRELIRDIELEHQSRDHRRVSWTPDALRAILNEELRGQEVIVVSNREPCIHVRRNGEVMTQRPASGLVTALEPIMRATSGTWIAHGGGSADREVVDQYDRVGVPQDDPDYELRRVWLTPEEEAGYYYGFSNEGLWPLCHIAHVRPTFRSSDWEQYVNVNRKFARAVIEEARSGDPIVMVQDYHFALLPQMIKEALPGATVITFWHIPWPNPEAFGICPWREELVDGLLGSTILGFHTQFHCNNFVDTVDRLLEARVDRETLTVSYRHKLTAVKRYPISVDWPVPAELLAKPVEDCRREIRERHGFPPGHAIGVGVDRLDYTKGIEERLRAVERLLEVHPEWVGKFSFIQIAAPTRTSIGQYRDYEMRVREMVASINARFTRTPHPPLVLHVEHHEPQRIYEYYRGAEFCFVSSLHDGMNLVAKEFLSSRDDEQGVLILSQFTGAAREVPEAVIVNPYDTDQCATAMHVALSMSPGEQRGRMRLMRGLIQEFNVYRWAGRMLIDAAATRRRERVLGRGKSRTLRISGAEPGRMG